MKHLSFNTRVICYFIVYFQIVFYLHNIYRHDHSPDVNFTNGAVEIEDENPYEGVDQRDGAADTPTKASLEQRPPSQFGYEKPVAVVVPEPAQRPKPNTPTDSGDIYVNVNVNVPGPVKVQNLEDYINSKTDDEMDKLSHEFDVGWNLEFRSVHKTWNRLWHFIFNHMLMHNKPLVTWS